MDQSLRTALVLPLGALGPPGQPSPILHWAQDTCSGSETSCTLAVVYTGCLCPQPTTLRLPAVWLQFTPQYMLASHSLILSHPLLELGVLVLGGSRAEEGSCSLAGSPSRVGWVLSLPSLIRAGSPTEVATRSQPGA